MEEKQPYREIIQAINTTSEDFKNYSNEEIKSKSCKLKAISSTSDTQKLITSFALAKEVINRLFGLTLYDTQLLGGLLLTNGTIIEMKTGEGKTLVATLPSYFRALEKKGVHVITVNEYLAERDWQKMKPLYSFLDLQAGLIKEEMELDEKQFNYNCDITYLTNTSLGFDYLRDNLATNTNQIVQRAFNFAVVDEVDSVLIDEALTPLIISGSASGTNEEKYVQSAFLAQYLKLDEHFIIDQKKKNCVLTEEGIKTCETLLNIDNLYLISDPWIPYILNAIRAKVFYIRNKNYIVENKKVFIIDEFTGRILYGRQWSQGLQQAIQVKENLKISSITQTYASITYQNLFLLYPTLSGMTGTAKTAELELEKIYQLQVNVLPTARRVQRVDLKDLVFMDEFTKWLAIVKICKENYMAGRPLLVGTSTIENSQLLSVLLKKSQINHKLLNAKDENAKDEAEIISQAGLPQSITIATNMAGRGADIVLGGNAKTLAQKKVKTLFFETQISLIETYRQKLLLKFCNKNHKLSLILFLLFSVNSNVPNKNLPVTADLNFALTDRLFLILTQKFKVKITQYYLQKYNTIVLLSSRLVKLRGGLFVIGTERHDSIRIDNQLRGRAGRQGDKGLSRFVLSLDDKLLKIFGGNNLQNIMKLGFDSNEIIQLESDMLTKNINKIQKKVEDFSYDSRNQLFKYDEIISNQREAIFAERKKILYGINVRDKLLEYTHTVINDFTSDSFGELQTELQLYDRSLIFANIFKINPLSIKHLFKSKTLTFDILQEFFYYLLWNNYELKECEIETFKPGLVRRIEKTLLLTNIDTSWKQHLQKMDMLKECIGWRGYGQKDPIIEYKNESYDLFLWTITAIRQGVLKQLYSFEIK